MRFQLRYAKIKHFYFGLGKNRVRVREYEYMEIRSKGSNKIEIQILSNLHNTYVRRKYEYLYKGCKNDATARRHVRRQLTEMF